MSKVPVQSFDKSVCADCPHRERAGESGGIVGAAASAEGKALEAVTGEKQYACGLCGCPLTNLALTGMVPATCPKVNDHGGRSP